MSIIKIIARTAILFTCSVIQTAGVLVEGLFKLLLKIAEGLVKLDNKLDKPVEKKPKKTIDIPL